jgi:sugar lactone lactonase YvrE
MRAFAAPRAGLGEAPVWDAEGGMLLSVDCVGRRLFRHTPDGTLTGDWPLPKSPGSYALRQGHAGLLMAYRNGLALVDPEAGRAEAIDAGPAVDFAVERFNDGRCDRRGRFWTGTMDRALRDPVGALCRIDADLSVRRMLGGITLSNGIAWSPDDRVMYHCDSGPALVRAYDFDLAAGAVENPRVLIRFAAGEGRPDGCTVDAEGFLWVAAVEAGMVVRFDPAGRRVREVRLPVSRPTSLAFGGEGLRTLFVTSMRHGMTEEELAREPLAGGILALDAGVAGLPETRFAG